MRYLARRLAHGLLVLVGISILSFIFTGMAPGDFLSDVRLDPRLSRETVAALRARYGLDQPLPRKYLDWVQSVSRGELGFSLTTSRSPPCSGPAPVIR
jgi:peptide/nickel transport system permease protein